MYSLKEFAEKISMAYGPKLAESYVDKVEEILKEGGEYDPYGEVFQGLLRRLKKAHLDEMFKMVDFSKGLPTNSRSLPGDLGDE